MKKAVFLDRDGVIAQDRGYSHKSGDLRLVKNCIRGLKLLKNYKLFIVTNQSGIGRGYFKFEDFLNYNNKIVEKLKKNYIKIEKTYVCPHKPEDNCRCRKPKKKFLMDAKKEFGIKLEKSFVIGDRKKDIEMGKKAKCRTVLVKSSETEEISKINADFVANDLLAAAKWILKNDKK